MYIVSLAAEFDSLSFFFNFFYEITGVPLSRSWVYSLV